MFIDAYIQGVNRYTHICTHAHTRKAHTPLSVLNFSSGTSVLTHTNTHTQENLKSTHTYKYTYTRKS